jgi:hypothetical protein
MRNVHLVIAAAAAVLFCLAPADAQTYYARQKVQTNRTTPTGAVPGDKCRTAPYTMWDSPWTFLSNVQGDYSEGQIQRIGEVPNTPGYPGANAICEAAIKGSQRTGCVVLGQPGPGMAIGVFMTVQDRPTTFYTDNNPDFLLIATAVTCTK